ncbi:MAG: hypothetical protein AAFV53_40080 [Myxococcota bacterium]
MRTPSSRLLILLMTTSLAACLSRHMEPEETVIDVAEVPPASNPTTENDRTVAEEDKTRTVADRSSREEGRKDDADARSQDDVGGVEEKPTDELVMDYRTPSTPAPDPAPEPESEPVYTLERDESLAASPVVVEEVNGISMGSTVTRRAEMAVRGRRNRQQAKKKPQSQLQPSPPPPAQPSRLSV